MIAAGGRDPCVVCSTATDAAANFGIAGDGGKASDGLPSSGSASSAKGRSTEGSSSEAPIEVPQAVPAHSGRLGFSSVVCVESGAEMSCFIAVCTSTRVADRFVCLDCDRRLGLIDRSSAATPEGKRPEGVSRNIRREDMSDMAVVDRIL